MNDREFEAAPDCNTIASMIRKSAFRAAWWLRNCHAQTIWPTLMRKSIDMVINRKRLELPDNDFIDLDWTTAPTGPIVIVLHGLEGSINSHYARGMLAMLQNRGYRPVLMHFRGCSGEHNRLRRSYHSGETGDLRFVIETLLQRFPGTKIALVGYSLGGNVILKYLGEFRSDAAVSAAATVSVPFLLARGADRLNQGFSRLYQRYLINKMQRKIIDKFSHRDDAPFALNDVKRWKDFYAFDDHVTAPLHGFKDSDDYYTRSSSRQYLGRIDTPTLILHACDDPFLTPDAIPHDNELSRHVTLELSEKGGHVGFISGAFPWCPRFWLEERIPDFLDEHNSNPYKQ